MIIDENILDDLTAHTKVSPHLLRNLDLHNYSSIKYGGIGSVV